MFADKAGEALYSFVFLADENRDYRPSWAILLPLWEIFCSLDYGQVYSVNSSDEY